MICLKFNFETNHRACKDASDEQMNKNYPVGIFKKN